MPMQRIQTVTSVTNLNSSSNYKSQIGHRTERNFTISNWDTDWYATQQLSPSLYCQHPIRMAVPVQLLHFWSSSQLIHLEKQQRTAQILEPLHAGGRPDPSSWLRPCQVLVVVITCWTSGFILVSSHCSHIESKLIEKRSICPSLSVNLPFK